MEGGRYRRGLRRVGPWCSSRAGGFLGPRATADRRRSTPSVPSRAGAWRSPLTRRNARCATAVPWTHIYSLSDRLWEITSYYEFHTFKFRDGWWHAQPFRDQFRVSTEMCPKIGGSRDSNRSIHLDTFTYESFFFKNGALEILFFIYHFEIGRNLAGSIFFCRRPLNFFLLDFQNGWADLSENWHEWCVDFCPEVVLVLHLHHK